MTPVSPGSVTFSGDLYATTGPAFSAAWDPSLRTNRKVGTATFAFDTVATATFTYVVVGAALVVLVGVLGVNYFVRRNIQNRLLSLVDVCRNFAGGDRAVRAAVTGDDEFAMLAMSLNSLLDSQNFTSGGSPVSR